MLRGLNARVFDQPAALLLRGHDVDGGRTSLEYDDRIVRRFLDLIGTAA
jgi:hypothetical protein